MVFQLGLVVFLLIARSTWLENVGNGAGSRHEEVKEGRRRTQRGVQSRLRATDRKGRRPDQGDLVHLPRRRAHHRTARGRRTGSTVIHRVPQICRSVCVGHRCHVNSTTAVAKLTQHRAEYCFRQLMLMSLILLTG